MRTMISGLLMMLLASALLVLPGCGPNDASAAVEQGPIKITFTVVNKTGGPMKSIGVAGAERSMGFRDLAAGATGSLSHKEPHTPEWLEVNWSNDRGDRYAAKAYVWNQLGESYRGNLTLTVTRRNKVELRGQ